MKQLGYSIKGTINCNYDCSYCLPAGTPVLMSDGTWKAIEKIEIGDKIVGFDEHKNGDGTLRKYRKSDVTAVMNRIVDGYRVKTDKGGFISSGDHKWLNRLGRWIPASRFRVGGTIKWVSHPQRPPEYDYEYQLGYFNGVSLGDASTKTYIDKNGYGVYKYRLAVKDKEILDRVDVFKESLELDLYRTTVNVGVRMEAIMTNKQESYNHIVNLLNTHIESKSYYKGFLAGIFDAEGSYSVSLRITNGDENLLSRIEYCLNKLGFSHTRDVQREDGVTAIRLLGGFSEITRFFASVNPACERKYTFYDKAMKEGHATIESIKKVQDMVMYDITTTTSTLIAGGFASHNCYEAVSRQENRFVGKQAGHNVDNIIDFVKNNREKVKMVPNLHGGEPLLLPKAENEKLFKYFFAEFGQTNIQTNASLVDDDYIAMFKKYKTTVGVSIDGHEELNDGRWVGTLEKTRKSTAKVIENIKWMKREGIDVGIIAVVNKHNGTKSRIPKLKEFLLMLKDIGIRHGRLNMIELDFPELAEELQIPKEEESYFYQEMAPFLRENDLQYAPFVDAVDSLLGFSHRTCVNTQCDPFHTRGEQPIYGDGTVGNCLRTTKNGVVNLAEVTPEGVDRVSNERYVILRQIPMEEGGCGGCRFFNICNADCPGSAEGGDWRNKSEHCESLYALYSETEKTLKKTLPSLRLTSENHGISDREMFERIDDGTASDLVFEAMNRKNTQTGGRRGAF